MSPTITRKAYLTDLTPPQWVLLCPLLKLPDGGASKTTDLQEVLNGILYHLRTGCQWRLLPHDFPPDGGSACQGGLDLRKERSKIRSSRQKKLPILPKLQPVL